MACNCEKKVNIKYSDGDTDGNGAIGVFLSKVSQILLGVVAAIIITVGVIPLLLWFIFCLLSGKPIEIKIPDINKWFNKTGS